MSTAEETLTIYHQSLGCAGEWEGAREPQQRTRSRLFERTGVDFCFEMITSTNSPTTVAANTDSTLSLCSLRSLINLLVRPVQNFPLTIPLYDLQETSCHPSVELLDDHRETWYKSSIGGKSVRERIELRIQLQGL